MDKTKMSEYLPYRHVFGGELLHPQFITLPGLATLPDVIITPVTLNLLTFSRAYTPEPVTIKSKLAKVFKKSKSNVVSLDSYKQIKTKKFKSLEYKYRVFEWSCDRDGGGSHGYTYEWSEDKQEIEDIVNSLNEKYKSYHDKFEKKGYFIQVMRMSDGDFWLLDTT